MLQKILVVLVGLVMSILGSLAPSGIFAANKVTEDVGLDAATATDEILATVRTADGQAFAKLSVLWVEVDGRRVTEDAWGTGELRELRFKVGVKDVEGLAMAVGDKVVPVRPTDVVTIRMFDGDFAYRGLDSASATLQLQGTVKTTLLNEGAPTGKLQTATGGLAPALDGRVQRSPAPGAVDRVAFVTLDTGASVDTVSVEVGGDRLVTKEVDATKPTQGAGNLLVKWVKIDGAPVREYTWGDGAVGRIEFEPMSGDARATSVRFGQQDVDAPTTARVLVRDFVGEYLVYQVQGGLLRLKLDGYAAQVTTGAEGGVPIEREPGAPIPAFESGPELARSTDVLTFRDRSVDDGLIVFWRWSFGDGTSAVLQDPTHRYAKPGVYNVTLNVTDDDLNSAEVTRTVVVRNSEPIVDFDVLPRIITTETLVQLSDRSLDADGVLVNWTWTFDDGSTSYARHPSHRFARGGAVPVSLTVTDDLGGRTTITKTVQVRNAPPVANFDFEPKVIRTGVPVVFTSTSVDKDGKLAFVEWSFGDGQDKTKAQASGEQVRHTYRFPGAYTVRLTVVDDLGDADTVTVTLTAINAEPSASFVSTATPPIVAGSEVKFHSTSSDTDGWIILNEWDFGDGSDTFIERAIGRCVAALGESRDPQVCIDEANKVLDNDPFRANTSDAEHNLPSPRTDPPLYDPPPDVKHEYEAAGSYNVTLCVTDVLLARSCTTRPLVVDNSAPRPDITVTPDPGIRGEQLKFVGECDDPDGDLAQIVNWTFDDGLVLPGENPVFRAYAALGIYSVQIICRDSFGNEVAYSESFSIENAAPTVSIGVSDSNPEVNETITFTAIMNDPDNSPGTPWFEWRVPDGLGNVTIVNATTFTWDFDIAATVVVTLRGWDGEGRESGGATRQLIIDPALPTPAFTYTPTNPNKLQTVQFTDHTTTNGPPIRSWEWRFGDGTGITVTDPSLRNVTHAYNEPGLYTATLTVDDGSATMTTSLPVAVNRAPTADFFFAPRDPGVGDTVTFTDTSTDAPIAPGQPAGAITRRVWDFGDGDTLDTANAIVTHVYTAPGPKTVRLTVYDNNAGNEATATLTKPLDVANGAPTAGFWIEPPNPRANQPVQFVSSNRSIDPDGDLTISYWRWDFGDGTILEGTDRSIHADPVHVYARSGTYRVTLIVGDGIEESQLSAASIRYLRVSADHDLTLGVRGRFPSGTFAQLDVDASIDTRLSIQPGGAATVTQGRAQLTADVDDSYRFTVPAGAWAEGDLAVVTMADARVPSHRFSPLTQLIRLEDRYGLPVSSPEVPRLDFTIPLPIRVHVEADPGGDQSILGRLGLATDEERAGDAPIYHDVTTPFSGFGRVEYANGEPVKLATVNVELRYLAGYLLGGDAPVRDALNEADNNVVLGWCRVDVTQSNLTGDFTWTVDDNTCVPPRDCTLSTNTGCALDKPVTMLPGRWEVRARTSVVGTTPATSRPSAIFVEPVGIEAMPYGLLP